MPVNQKTWMAKSDSKQEFCTCSHSTLGGKALILFKTLVQVSHILCERAICNCASLGFYMDKYPLAQDQGHSGQTSLSRKRLPPP